MVTVMPEQKVKTLGEFTERIREIRRHWSVKDHKDLWFRGESKKHSTALQPKLYRPRGKDRKSIETLLEIENDLFYEFQRCGVQLYDQKPGDADWDWDWYFLMQHHGAATRLLDWSDGALIALHFALRDKKEGDTEDAFVYVLEPDRLRDHLKALEEIKMTRRQWKVYAAKDPFYKGREDEWEHAYLPGDKDDFIQVRMPKAPLLLEFPHITRRVAAQRSRLMAFGTDWNWLSGHSKKADSLVKIITIKAKSVPTIKIELRDSGVTESVIFPDLDGLGREISQRWEDRK
jgi:hypothetical protein